MTLDTLHIDHPYEHFAHFRAVNSRAQKNKTVTNTLALALSLSDTGNEIESFLAFKSEI